MTLMHFRLMCALLGSLVALVLSWTIYKGRIYAAGQEFRRDTALFWCTVGGWAKAYYDMMCQDRGLKHQAAVRALAFKWIRILYCCWQNRTHYNEAHYFRSLYERQSPLLAFMASQTKAKT